MSDTAPEAYDPIELQRRMAVCLSVSELQRLAGALGLGDVAGDRGASNAAREVVQKAERYCGLSTLVARLREQKPLVEWPDPLPAAPAPVPSAPAPVPSAPAPVPSAPASAPGAGMAFVPLPSLGAQPGSLGAPPQAATVAAAPLYVEQAASAPAPMSAPAPVSAPRAAPPPPHAPIWPGTIQDPLRGGAPPASRGLDPRILVAVAGLTVVAALIAYIAGRASSSSGAPEANAAASPSASAAAARPANGLAARAAGAMTRSLVHVARSCELPGSAGGGADVLRRAYERCGPVSTRGPNGAARTPAPAGADDPSAPSAANRPAAEPPRDKRPAAKAAPDPAPALPATPGKACTNKCASEHRECTARCGPEPTEGSRYEGYNVCLSRCLRSESQCRLSCQ